MCQVPWGAKYLAVCTVYFFAGVVLFLSGTVAALVLCEHELDYGDEPMLERQQEKTCSGKVGFLTERGRQEAVTLY